ncbi:MAG: tetratricopeptide repeat protein [Desulfobacterales bacterium]
MNTARKNQHKKRKKFKLEPKFKGSKMLLPKLFGLVAQFCTKAFLSKLIALPRYIYDNLFMLIAKIVTICLIVIFIYEIIGSLDDKIVFLEPITVPLEYIEKYGISEQSLTNLLIDKLRFIDTNVSTRISGHEFTYASSDSALTFKYQDISIPLNLLYSFLLRDVLKIKRKVINGSVMEVGGEICVVIRLVGEPGDFFCFPRENFKDIKSSFTKIADHCYTQINPYCMALYHFQRHRADIVENGKKPMSDKYIENLLSLYQKLEKSKNITDDIIEKSPEDRCALNLNGLICLELADLADPQDNQDFITKCYEDARESFKNSIDMAEKAKKTFPPPHTGMGHLYYVQKKFIKSFSKYNEAIEDEEEDVLAYLRKANSLLQFFLGNNKGIQDKEILQDRVLIRKIKFFPDDYKSVEEVFNAPKNTQKTYAIGFYNDAIKQFKDVGRKRSNVPKSLVQLYEIIEILEIDEKIDKNKEKLEALIKELDANNPI